MKSKVKEKRSKIRQHFNRTGGGPPTELRLTELEEKIVAICGEAAIDGDEAIDEMGFASVEAKTPLKESNTSENTMMRKRLFSTDDCVVVSDGANSTTMETKSKIQKVCETLRTPTKQNSTPSSSRVFNTQQNQVNLALSLQTETNGLLKQIIEQNNEIIDILKTVTSYVTREQKENMH